MTTPPLHIITDAQGSDDDAARLSRLTPRKALLFTLVLLGGLLALSETGLRLTGRGPFVLPDLEKPGVTGYFWMSDEHLGFRNRAHGSYRFDFMRDNPLNTTGDWGYRTTWGGAPRGDEPAIVFVGDSTTYCAEVNDDETFASEVARQLARRHRIKVVNAGVRGYNTLQAKRMLDECLEHYPGTKIAVYTYTGNDWVENLNPIIYLPIKSPTVWWNADRTQLADVEVTDPPAPWGENILEAQARQGRAVLGRRVVFTDWLRSRSALIHHGLRALRNIANLFREAPAAPPPEPVAPNAPPPIALPDGSLGPVDGRSKQWLDQIEWAREHGAGEAVGEFIRQMSAACERRGAVLVVTVFSRGGNTAEERDIALLCEKAGVRFVPIAAAFNDKPEAYCAPYANGDLDSHYSPRGTKTYAAVLAPALAEILADSAKK